MKKALLEGQFTRRGDIVEIKYTDPWQPYLKEIKVDLAKGAMVVSERTRFHYGTLIGENRVEKAIQTPSGKWIATEISEADFVEMDGEPAKVFTVRHHLENVNERLDIPDKEFDISFPPGTTVHDDVSAE